MDFTLEDEIKLKAVSLAGQVALEFLRARPSSVIDTAAENYNSIFKRVYQHILEITRNNY